ncbi:hypothetical protein AMECASPLE_021761, partial [Ameca splendens]
TILMSSMKSVKRPELDIRFKNNASSLVYPSIHPSVFYTHFFRTMSWGSWCLSPVVYGREARYTLDRTSPLQGNTSCTPKGNLGRPINLTVMFWTVGGSQSIQRKPTHGWEELTNSMQKDARPGVEPRTFLLQGNSATCAVTVRSSTDIRSDQLYL